MIRFLRFAVLVSGFAFACFFGQTAERFLLEVLRFFIAVDSSNALLFNSLHLLILLVPVGLLGLVLSLVWSGESAEQDRVLSLVWGLALGVTAFRLCQVWVLFRTGGLGANPASFWTQPLGAAESDFYEHLLPYLLSGAFAAGAASVRMEDPARLPLWAALSVLCAFAWIWATRRPPELLHGPSFAKALSIMHFGGLFTSFTIQKIRNS